MKNSRSSLIMVFCCLYLLINNLSYGQTTTLAYKVKGKTTFSTEITFANKSGNTELQPTEYFNYSEIYFVLTPKSESAKDVFREDDAKDILSKITIDQGGDKINQSESPKFLLNAKSKIEKVIITYSKEDILDYNSFSFSLDDLFSEKIKIGEQYFQSLIPQKKIYEQGLSKINGNDFLGAYESFMKIVENAKKNREILSFSFYQPVLKTEIPNSIESYINATLAQFEKVNEHFRKEKTIAALNDCDSLVKLASKNIESFNPYLSLEDVDVSASNNRVVSFLNTLNEQNLKNISAFEQEKMLFFKQENYKNYKFSLYLDMISKMLLYKNSLSFINKIGPIDINLLKNFPESKKELSGDWGNEFKIYIDLINKNIERSGLVFKKEVMDNLMDLSSTQKQPYFEIFSAFNSLNKDTDSFKDNFKLALTKSSDETIMDYIEYWLLSFRLTDERINSTTLSQLNEGISLIQKEQYDRADATFDLLMRVANEYAPVWFYSGKIKHGMGESFSAERFFKKALEIYPDYIAPRKFILKLNEDNKNYTQLLENANSAIKSLDTWFFHYKRAVAYYHLEWYKEAITEINSECLKRNNWDINQYFLLGDTYLALKDFDKAKEAYEKTLDINPFLNDSKSFDERMKKVYEKMEDSRKSKAKEELKKEELKKEIIENVEEIK